MERIAERAKFSDLHQRDTSALSYFLQIFFSRERNLAYAIFHPPRKNDIYEIYEYLFPPIYFKMVAV